MGRVTEEEAVKYSSSNGSWFQLKNDKDVADVQFVYDNPDDLAPYICHKIKVGDKERYVDCLSTYGRECPLCHAGHQTKAVRFVIMFQHSDQQMKVWERGKTFIQSIQGFMNRYNPISQYVFQIERNGKPGDMKTQYQIYPMPNIQPYDLTGMEIPQIMGSIILEKNEQEMEEYLQTGAFPNDEQPQQSQPVQRGVPQQPVPRQAVSRRDVPVSDRGVF